MSTDSDRASTAATGPAGEIWTPAYRVLTVGLVLAVTFVAFEALAVATILPVVGRHLGDLRLYGWVFSAFLLPPIRRFRWRRARSVPAADPGSPH